MLAFIPELMQNLYILSQAKINCSSAHNNDKNNNNNKMINKSYK